MSAPALLLDLIALQDQLHNERGIARFVASHARALLNRPGIVRRLFLNPSVSLPAALDPALRTSPLLRWNSAAEMDEAMNEGPSALYVMSPFADDTANTTLRLHARVPVIATLYDLIPLLHPDLYLNYAAYRVNYMARIERLRRADLLLAISESARKDALELLGLPPDRVATIGTGIDPQFKPLDLGAQPVAEPFKKLGLAGPYVMTVLGDDPRKNLPGMLDAMAMLPASVDRETKLLVVGSYGEEGRQRYRSLPGGKALGERLVFSGKISDDWLVALYQRAAVHVFPSFYEGFGLPVAEAAACGCPSITSNTSSLPEVLDDPETTFDPKQPGEISALMMRVLTDTSFRERIVRRGLAVARQHTWDRVAERTIAAVAAAADRLNRRTRLPVPRKPRIALVGPMPPARSGIADYNERICRELQYRCKLDVFMSHEDSRPSASLNRSRCLRARSLLNLVNPAFYDSVIYTFGNSEHHIETLDVHRAQPGWVWLHEVRLYGLLERYAHTRLEPCQADEFLCSTLRNQYARRTPFPPPSSTNIGYDFLRNCDIGFLDSVTQHARGILLHSAHAAEMFRRDLPPGAAMPPISLIPLAFPEVRPADARTFSAPWIIAHFGIVDPIIKNGSLLIRAFAELRRTDATLVFVGPVWHEFQNQMLALAASLHIEKKVSFTGNISAEEYGAWLRRAHIAVQLRAFSNGESSAALNDAIAAGTPAITNIQSTSGWPPGTITRLPPAPTIAQLRDAIENLLADPPHLARQSEAGLALARENSIPKTVDHLLAAIGL